MAFPLRPRLRTLHRSPSFTASAPAASRASLSASLTSTNAFQQLPETPIFRVSACTAAAACAGMMRGTVLPHRLRVSDQTGPCPESPGSAQ